MTSMRWHVTRVGKRALARCRRSDDSGFSLIEMVIALSLVSGVFVIGTSLMLTAFRGNDQVNTTTQSTMQAQGVAQGLERAVRNGRRINVSGNTLTVWTTLAGNQACQRWSVADGFIKVARGTNSIGPAANFGPATQGATLSFPSTETDGNSKVVGVTYEVTFPSDTRPVKVAGTVRSRTPHDSTATAANACGLAP